MRLHRLEVTAFGPFADHQEVDFDRLSTAGLFLLHGPTGAGKTSVLDAVCFALYGRVPGARHGTGRLRSDHAAADVPPSVTCEFTVAGRRFEVTRTPEWQRPKKRGTGTVRQNTTATVRERVGDGWVAAAYGVQESSDLLKDLLGLDVDQFTKLILLPQGDFAAFLRAGAEERRPLLQKLFGTDRFADVERWLAERRRSLDHDVQATRRQTEVLFARASQARLPSTPGDADEADDEVRRPEDAAALVERWAGHAAAVRGAAHAEVTAAEEAHEVARRAVEAAEAARAEEERRRALAEELAALEAAEPQQRARRAAAEAAAAAQVLIPLLADLTTTRAAAAAAGTAHRTAAEALATPPSTGLPPPDAVRERLDGARAELATLATLLDTERAVHELDAAARRAEGVIEAAGRRAAEAEAALTAIGTRRDELTAARSAAELLAVTRPDAEQALGDARARAAAARRIAVLDDRLVTARDAVRAAVDAHQAAVGHVQTLRARRLDGMAAELAAALADAAPCPVCGATDHPHPASPGAATVTGEEQEAADEAETRAAAGRERTQQEVAELERERAAGLAVTAGADVPTTTAALDRARARVAEASAAADQLVTLDAGLADLAARADRAAQARRAAADEEAAARQTLAGIAGRRGELADRIDAARGDDPDLRSRSARITAGARADAAYLEAVAALDEATTRLRRATAAAEGAATAAGFADLAAATAAARPEAERRALAERIRRHDDALARVHGLLDELARAEERAEPADAPADAGGQLSFDFTLPAEPGPAAEPHDLDELRARRAAARDRHEAARERHTLAVRAVSALTGLAADLTRHAETSAPLRERFAVVESVSRCVEGTGGDNLLKMRLSSYVLAARLEQVADAAGDRLAAMSGGRFTLVHTDGPSRGGGRSGLGLAVIDGWTGVQRDPATLSGGETFCTSLALALGLADVVQAEAGGTSIDTLLVDEGFGSLDEDTLDEVMDVLDGLRSAGRAVGLVSHVADLRDRIPARLEVVKTRTGSRLIA